VRAPELSTVLPVPPSAAERHRIERLLAIARAALAASLLVIGWLGGADIASHSPLVLTLLALYTGQSIAVAAALHYPHDDWKNLARCLCAIDIAWAATLTALTAGPASPFFILFLFVIVSAAFRWGLRETFATGAFAIAVVLAQAVVLNYTGIFPGGFDGQDLLTRISYLACAALLLGHLAEEGRIHRAELAAMGHLFSAMQGPPGFGGALRRVAAGLIDPLGADAVVLVARELGSGRSIVWKAEPAAQQWHAAVIHVSQHSEREVDSYLFPARGDAWAVVRDEVGGERASRTVLALAHEGQALSGTEWNGPDAFWETHGARAVAAVAVRFGGQWKGRAFVLRDRPFRAAELRFLHRALSQMVPAMHDRYLLRRLHTPVTEAERRRLARELRDGLVQSLGGLGAEMAEARKSVAAHDPGIGAQLQRIEARLAIERESVRALVQHIRPFGAAPDQVLDAFRQIVERFGRETGISSRFWSDDEHDVYLPPKTARELARALQEALTNVHKHAGARQVDVRFSGDDESWHLAIFNDGRPFGFQGRYTLHDLDTLQRGPRKMKKRVREMRADLTIESSASGVRIDVILPRVRTSAAS
jgi:signal transduction histidine kinase